MKLKKQIFKKESLDLRASRKKEIEKIMIFAEHLETYLQLAYEESQDAEAAMEYMHDAELVSGLPLKNEHLRHLAAMIYTHAQALQFVEKRVLFDENRFSVEIFIQETPF